MKILSRVLLTVALWLPGTVAAETVPSRGAALAHACVTCHAMPLPQREFHGTVGPLLDGIGRRAMAGVLRLRLVDAKAFNPETIMPAYYKVEGLHRVLDRYHAKPILTAQQIEDVIAYLLTLTD
jgi:L-cysteine S-thiosulfotransferase